MSRENWGHVPLGRGGFTEPQGRLISSRGGEIPRESIKASREKIEIFLEEHDDNSYTFSWKADQIIKILEEE